MKLPEKPARFRVGFGAPAILALGLVGAAILVFARTGAHDQPLPSVHAERAGLQFDTQALTGRVTLVASQPGVRWRIVGLTGWRSARGKVLLREWDTTGVRDGSYRLQLSGDRSSSKRIVVRNHTPLPAAPLANASAGLNTRSVDARSVVATFTRRSYRAGERAIIRIWDGTTVS